MLLDCLHTYLDLNSNGSPYYCFVSTYRIYNFRLSIHQVSSIFKQTIIAILFSRESVTDNR